MSLDFNFLRFRKLLLLCTGTLMVCAPGLADLISDDFDAGTISTNLWSSIAHGKVRGAGEPGFNGSHALWFDGGYASWSGAEPRYATTHAFNTVFGGTLSFSLRAGDDSLLFWEQPESGEELQLMFSANHGVTWHMLQHFRISETSTFGSWSRIAIDLPAIAREHAVQFRFEQLSHSGEGWDHWALDDVELVTDLPVGTSWSQALPAEMNVVLTRVNPGGGLDMVIEASGSFSAGGFTGGSGWYLGQTSADGAWQRLTKVGSNNQTATFSDMAIDSSGNVYLCGSYRNAIFGLPSAYTTPNAFLVKFASDHQMAWARAGFNLTSSTAVFAGLCVDTSERITVVGDFHSLMRFGANGNLGEPELNSGDQDSSLMARYDSAGNYLWSMRIGEAEATDPLRLRGIRCDAAGNLYLFGNYLQSLSIPPFSLGQPAGLNPALGFVLKCSVAGVPQWLTNFGHASDMLDVAVYSGTLYATGWYGSNGAEFTPLGEVIPPAGSPDSAADDLFLLAANINDGHVNWVETAGPVTEPGAGSSSGTREALRVDAGGNIYWIYAVDGDHTLGRTQAVSVSHFPAFNVALSRWSPAGVLGWHKRASADFVSVDLDSIGQMYAAGRSGPLAVLESEAVIGSPEVSLVYKFNNIFEATGPVAVSLARQTIPSDWRPGRDLGPLVIVDADNSGTYDLGLVDGVGSTHNAMFTINTNNHLVLSSSARFAAGDVLSMRVRAVDQAGIAAESIIKCTVVEPEYNQWAKGFSFDDGGIDGMASGPNGSVYLAGYFYGAMQVDTISVTSTGSSDFFVMRIDSEGQPLWVVSGGGTGFDRAWNLDVDASGNVYVAGQVSGGFNLSRNGASGFAQVAALPTGGGRDACVFSLTADGALRWLNLSGGTMNDTPRGIQVDEASGRCVVAGSFSGDYNLSALIIRDPVLGIGGSFPGATLAGNGIYSSASVISYSASGEIEWGRTASGAGQSNPGTADGYDAVIDASGNVYAVGRLKDRISFSGLIMAGSGTGSSSSNYDLFLWKIGATGSNAWVRKGGNPAQPDEGLAVGLAPLDQPVIAGLITGYTDEQATFGSLAFTPDNSDDVVIIRYDSSGVAKEGHQIGGPENDELTGLTVLPGGAMLIGASANTVDGSNLTTRAFQHYITAGGDLVWSGYAHSGSHTAFAPNLMPLIGGQAYGGQEIAGTVLDAGPFVARIQGPTPLREAPSAILLAPAGAISGSARTPAGMLNTSITVPENQPVGTIIAELSANDTDSTSFYFELRDGLDAEGNTAFRIVDHQLQTAVVLNYEEITSYPVRVRVIDESGLAYEQAITIGVGDLPDTLPAAFALSDLIHEVDGMSHSVSVAPDPAGLPYVVTYNGTTNEPSSPGPFVVVVVATHPEYAGSATNVLWIQDAHHQWLTNYFNAALLFDPAREADGWGWLADPDHDGVANIFEFYFQGNPALADAVNNRVAVEVNGSDGVAGFVWVRRKNGPPATLMWSEDLANWFTSGSGPPGYTRNIIEQVVDDFGDYEAMNATLSPPGERAFVRFEIEAP